MCYDANHEIDYLPSGMEAIMADKKREKEKSLENAGLAGAQAETVQRYGSAVEEHFVSYSGMDNESQTQLAKGLKQIAESKVDPNNPEISIKQQAGFSAEVKTQARESAEKIIAGEEMRITRTDDMTKQSDGRGHAIGGKNEQLYDIAEVDVNGIYVEGTGRQLKFVGGNAKECCQKLLDKKYDKYRDAGVPIEIPSDFYDDVSADLSKRIDELNNQIQNAEAKGNLALAEKHKNRLRVLEDTKNNLRRGSLTNGEALEARLHPKISVAKDIARISHRAGIEAAKSGAAIGSGVSMIRNSVAVIKGDKGVDEAVGEVIIDTAKATGISYSTAYTGALVKGAMQNAPSSYLQTLSKTNLPSTIVVTSLEIGKTLTRYARGDIDGTECLTELGEKGTGMLAASAGAAVGQVLIPIPVVGGLIGSMAGYAMSSAYYNSLVSVLNEAKVAHEERLRIEAECAASIAAIKEYQLEIELVINNYLRENIEVFSNAFAEMELAYNTGDVDSFIGGTNSIVRQLGGVPLFETQEDFDELMKSNITFEL
jgi:hypothetical protein